MKKSASKTRKFLNKLGAAALGLLMMAVAAEAAVRVMKGKLLSFESTREAAPQDRSFMDSDDTLGWVPSAGVHERRGWTATVDEHGFRKCSANDSNEGSPILAVGDSFTFCDEVDDEHCWTTSLAELTGRRVLNAGASGYGLDQAVLRAERLLPEVAPELLLLVYISGQLDRSEYSFTYSWKPYFDIVDAQLRLQNVPVPSADPAGALVWRLTNWSYAAKAVVRRIAPERAFYRLPKVHRDGDLVARLLVTRLKEAADANGAKLVVVSVRGARDDVSRTAALNAHVRSLEVPLLDLIPQITEMKNAPPPGEKLFEPGGHLAPRLNQFLAERVHEFIEAL